jgi:hypothetical protein
MLLRIPEHVQATLEAEFSFQVKTALTHAPKQQTRCPQAALPSLPPIVPEITPGKADKPATETLRNNQGKRKASDAPPCPRQNSTNPLALFANATIKVAASAAAVIAAVTTTATTAAAAGTSSANALEVPGTTSGNALTVHDSDSDATDDTLPPPMFPKKEHGLKIILAMNINNHLKLIKSDISIVAVKPEPGTSNTNYVNGIHFLATVLTITEAPVVVMDLLPHLTNGWQFPLVLCGDMEIYIWDGQTLCCDGDFLRDKTSLTSQVPCFCSIFNSNRSSNFTNLLITMATLHSNAAMASLL